MKPLTDKQRLDTAIKLANVVFQRGMKYDDCFLALDLIARLDCSDEFIKLNRENFQPFIPNFMEETE